MRVFAFINFAIHWYVTRPLITRHILSTGNRILRLVLYLQFVDLFTPLIPDWCFSRKFAKCRNLGVIWMYWSGSNAFVKCSAIKKIRKILMCRSPWFVVWRHFHTLCFSPSPPASPHNVDGSAVRPPRGWGHRHGHTGPQHLRRRPAGGLVCPPPRAFEDNGMWLNGMDSRPFVGHIFPLCPAAVATLFPTPHYGFFSRFHYFHAMSSWLQFWSSGCAESIFFLGTTLHFVMSFCRGRDPWRSSWR